MARYLSFDVEPQRMTETRRSSMASIGSRALEASHSHTALRRGSAFASGRPASPLWARAGAPPPPRRAARSSSENGLAYPDPSADAAPVCFRGLGPPRPYRRTLTSARLTRRKTRDVGKRTFESDRRTWRDVLVEAAADADRGSG